MIPGASDAGPDAKLDTQADRDTGMPDDFEAFEAAMAAMSLIKGTCFRGPRRIKRSSLRNAALVFDYDDDDDYDKLIYVILFCQQTS